MGRAESRRSGAKLVETHAPSPRASAAKHAAILRAATRVFLDLGFDGTTMDAVATAAGVSKATVYAHFGDKRSLFREIVLGRCRIFRESVESGLAVEGVPDVVLRGVARALLRLVVAEEHVALYRMLVAVAPREPELGEEFYASGPKAMIEVLADYFERESARGRLALGDPTTAAETFLGAISGHRQIQELAGVAARLSPGELERNVDAAVAFFLDGVRPRARRPTRPLRTPSGS